MKAELQRRAGGHRFRGPLVAGVSREDIIVSAIGIMMTEAPAGRSCLSDGRYITATTLFEHGDIQSYISKGI